MSRRLKFVKANQPPTWALLSLATNGLLILTGLPLLMRDYSQLIETQARASATQINAVESVTSSEVELGPRHRLSYQEWVAVLGREAKAVAENRPQRLTILAGDSLSLWFPPQLLPGDRNWLNQGISGETSEGLLKRLNLFEQTQPETIFVMIGINDLLRGFSDQQILANQQQIVRQLSQTHPKSQIVLQSILPYAGKEITWEGRERLQKLSNQRIRYLNRQLAALAVAENIRYLNLHPLFTDPAGNLRPELSTDGLHLNAQGYLVWRSALQLFSQLELDPQAAR